MKHIFINIKYFKDIPLQSKYKTMTREPKTIDELPHHAIPI